MKFLPLLALLIGAVTASAQQKPERKTLTFQPGAKTPDAAAEAAPAVLPATASDPKAFPIDPPGQAATLFFIQLEKRLIDEAYAGLMKGSKIAERPEELRALKTKTTEAIELFGPIAGYDLVESKQAGPHLLRRTYVSLGRDFPLRWRFYFYQTEGQWRVVDLRVDDRLGGIFDEAEEARPVAEPAK